MRTGMVCRCVLLGAMAASGAGIASAYTNVYLTNNTGQRVFSLHVKLTKATAESAVPGLQFEQARVLNGGLELDFSQPLDPLGVADGVSIQVGWVDLDPESAASVEWYYWTDAAGNRIGDVQYVTPPGGGGDGEGGFFFSSGGGGGGTPPPGSPIIGGTPGSPDPSSESAAVPEPGTAGLLAGAALLAAWGRRRMTARS